MLDCHNLTDSVFTGGQFHDTKEKMNKNKSHFFNEI